MYFLLSACLCLSAQTRIAVYVSGVLAENYNTLLGDNLVEAFAGSKQYIAVNRSEALNSMLKKAHSIQENGHVDYTQVVSATKQYGESQLCAVNVIEIDYMYVFRASLLDVLTNTVIKTASAESPKSEIGYTKILEIAKKLSGRLLPDVQQSHSDYRDIDAASEVEFARSKVEENRKYNISYATFQNNVGKYTKENSSSNYYWEKARNLDNAGILLLTCLTVPVGGAAGLGIGLGLSDMETGPKIGLIAGVVAVAMIPGVVCFSVKPAYEKKAWRAYREPYDNAMKELENARKYRQRASLELAPVVGYDWAGLSMRIKLN